jgi:glycosyltransferase involved in cell wall biosynthesis
MKYLYIAELPVNVERQAEFPGINSSIDGGRVAVWNFVENVIRFSRQDRIIFPRKPWAADNDFRDLEVVRQNPDRVRFVNSAELFSEGGSKDMLLLSASWGLDQLLVQRSATGNHALPCVSLIHSLCSPPILNHILTLILSNCRDYDALVSSSVAGQKVLRSMWRHVAQALETLEKCPRPEANIPVIPLGVSEQFFTEASVRESVASPELVEVLYLGRFSVTSKADLTPLLLVWQQIAKTHAPCRLTIAGDDSQSNLGPVLKDTASLLGCSASVQIEANPSFDRKLELYRRSHIFVSPSDSFQETYGLTVAEAMAVGLPVVASDWSGYKELVEDGVTGFLIPTRLPGDLAEEPTAKPFLSDLAAACTAIDTETMRQKLSLLIANPKLRHCMGIRGRERAHGLFRWEQIIRRHDDLWDELRARASRPAPARLQGGFLETSPERFFASYATSTITAELKVRRKQENVNQALVKFQLATRTYREGEHLRRVYLSSSKHKWTPINELATAHGEPMSSLMTNDQLLCHIGRLAKYDLIEFSLGD